MYCIKFKLNIHCINVDNVIAFIEILAGRNYSCTTIGTYVLAMKAKYTEFYLSIEPWLHNKVARMLNACARTAAFPPPSSVC